MERIGAKHLLDSALRMATPNRGLFLVAIVVVVVLPTLNAALIPFADLVAFSHLNSFPSKLSYGPIHYYVVEMTYIVPHLISRTLLDFGIPASQQVFFYYALQVVFWAGFASLMIHRFAGNLRAAIVFQIWGILVAYPSA